MAAGAYSGKRGSNAGDDYHELWAIRRSLELLQPGTALRAVTVEGVLASDEAGVDAALWDGVDAACYYGAEAESPDRIELVQLKYSGAAPGSSWTIARLCSADNRGKTNSVMARLASAWRAARERHPELAAAEGIIVQLVSNQPVSAEVVGALQAPGRPGSERLHQASGLPPADFDDFARALDLSGCGGASRFALEDRVLHALSALKDGDVRADFATLREFLRNRMRPEGRGQSITAENIFSVFGHSSSCVFFPCPSRIEAVEPLIPRAAVALIAERLTAGAGKLCLHGAGGEGKTTVLQDLARRLPEGSELIVYDCYGAGTYLDANGLRHRSEDAFLQMANDAAARLLLPPVFQDRALDHPRRFARKLEAAADVVAARAPEALLVIAVDAADNAITAARLAAPPETAFVQAFLRLGGLPSNVRLLVTARTGNLQALSLPDEVDKVQLAPFTPEETRHFAESRLGEQAEDWHAEFHRLSDGNARVQHYAIDYGDGDARRALDYLNPTGKDLNAIFAARFTEARRKAGVSRDIGRLCAGLTTLPRPTPAGHLAAVAELEPSRLRDLVLDLAPGLRWSETDRVGFADEDFEDFVRAQGQADRVAAISAAADRLMAQRGQDGYACAHAADLALLADRREDVMSLVKEPLDAYAETDPGVRNAIQRRRLKAAMHVCRAANDIADAASLLLRGAQAIKTDEAIFQALTSNLALAVSFSRDDTVNRILHDRTRRRVHGELLLQLCASDGVAQDLISLNAHLRAFLAWQDTRNDRLLPAEETEEDARHREPPWPIPADAVAAMIIGRLHAEGAEVGATYLGRARPRRFRWSILVRTIQGLSRRGDLALLRQLAKALPERHPGQPMITLALAVAGECTDGEGLLHLVERWATRGGARLKMGPAGVIEPDEQMLLFFDACDLVVLQGGDRGRLLAVLDPIIAAADRSAGDLARPYARSDHAVRAYALARVLRGEEATFTDFAQPSSPLKTKPGRAGGVRSRPAGQTKPEAVSADEARQDLEKAKAAVQPILAVHMVRAQILVGQIAPEQAAVRLDSAISDLRRRRQESVRPWEWQSRDDELVDALLTLGAIKGVDATALFRLVGQGLSPLGGLVRHAALKILRRASQVPAFRPALVTFAVARCEEARSEKAAAQDRIDALLALSDLLLPVNRDAARYAYEAALTIAGDVDTDALHALMISAPLAHRAPKVGTAADRRGLATDFSAVVQDAALKIGDNDHFPWIEIASALSALDPAVAFAAAARLAELDLLPGTRFLCEVLEEAARTRSLDPVLLAAFVPVLDSPDAMIDAVLRDPSALPGPMLETCAEAVMRDPPADLAPIAAKMKMGAGHASCTESLLAAAAFQAALPTDSVSEVAASPSPYGAGAADPALWRFDGIDGVAAFKSRVEALLAADPNPHPSRRHVAGRLLCEAAAYQIRTALQIVRDLPEDDSIVYDPTDLMGRLLDRWTDQPAAEAWAREHLLAFVEQRLPEFTRYIAWRGSEFEALLRRSGADDLVVVTRLLSAVERHMERLSAIVIYHLVGAMAAFLEPSDAQSVLRGHIDLMMQRVEPDGRRLPGFSGLCDGSALELGAAAPDKAAARFLYAELGHINHRHRWRAAHAVRDLVRLGRGDLLAGLIARYEATEESIFSHPTAPFYFLAARLWFMLVLSRIAWETPSALIEHRTWLLEQGERSDFPHLLVRAAARKALEGLQHAFPARFSLEDGARIAAINESPLPRLASGVKRYDKGFRRHEFATDPKLRFRFDALDTLPYWYTPLLQCFAEPDADQFLQTAERWIVDRLGVTGDIWSYDRARGNDRFNRQDGSLHGHGSLPTVERYRTYLEWHAMFLAGGELLNTWPLPPAENSDSWGELGSWLAREGPTLAPLWLSDLRGPKPLEEELWRSPAAAGWMDDPSLAAKRAAFTAKGSEWIALSAYRHFRRGQLEETRHVEAALVAPETATALRLALAASEDHYQYRLPSGPKDDDIVAAPFILKSVVVEGRTETALDVKDPLRAEVTAPRQLPHPRLLEALQLLQDPSGLPIWRAVNGSVVLENRAWSDPIRNERSAKKDFGSGETLLIRKTALRRLLADLNLDLFCEISITRRLGERSYGEPESTFQERRFDQLLVLRGDGSIDAGEADFGSWA